MLSPPVVCVVALLFGCFATASASPAGKHGALHSATGMITRRSCPSSSCSSGCRNLTIPGGTCQPSLSGGYVKFACRIGKVTEQQYSDSACSKSSGTPESYPTNECLLDTENGAYVEWSCIPPTIKRTQCSDSTCTSNCASVATPGDTCTATASSGYVTFICTETSVVENHYTNRNCTNPTGKPENYPLDKCLLGEENYVEWTCESEFSTPRKIEIAARSLLSSSLLERSAAINRTICGSSGCTTDCHSTAIPENECMPTTFSDYVKFFCTGGYVKESRYSDSSCASSAGNPSLFPTQQCLLDVQNSDYVRWACRETQNITRTLCSNSLCTSICQSTTVPADTCILTSNSYFVEYNVGDKAVKSQLYSDSQCEHTAGGPSDYPFGECVPHTSTDSYVVFTKGPYDPYNSIVEYYGDQCDYSKVKYPTNTCCPAEGYATMYNCSSDGSEVGVQVYSDDSCLHFSYTYTVATNKCNNQVLYVCQT